MPLLGTSSHREDKSEVVNPDPEVLGLGIPALGDSRRSVRGKLIRLVVITTVVAVSVAAVGMMTYDLSVYRRSWTTELSNESLILGVSVAPALAFDDRDLASRNLQAMSVRPSVLSAALYTVDGKLYASYARDPASAAPEKPPTIGATMSGERVEVSQAVVRNGEVLGYLYLRAHYSVWGRLGAYLGIFLADLALSLGIAFVLSRRLQRAITGPLDAITTVAQAVVSRRDYSLRALKSSDDEIGLAVVAFNGMLDEIEARASITAAAMAALRSEVQVRQQAEAALLEADRRKDEFLATLAHELRNPLAPIRHAVKLLEGATLDESQRQWGRAVIGRQVQRMALLLDDLLDVSRITRGQLTLKTANVDLRTVVEAAVEVARPLIDTKQHELIMHLPDNPLMIDCDPLRLSQSISNLLSNAAKYTDNGGRITLSVELLADELKLSVRDSGIGIQPKAIPGLFHIFSQLDSAIDRAEGGLGIGLALVKGLIGLHGGRVEVVSPGAGLGSEFSLYLPRSRVSTDTEPHSPVARTEPLVAGSVRKVLMADDNRDAVDSMALLLELAGYQTMVAYTGQRAVAMAREHRPDIVLLDIGMPDMTGYDAARAIRQLEHGQSIYLIAITGWGQAEDKARAVEAGFDEHLTKPVDPDRLAEVVHHGLRTRQPRAVT